MESEKPEVSRNLTEALQLDKPLKCGESRHIQIKIKLDIEPWKEFLAQLPEGEKIKSIRIIKPSDT